MPHPGTDGEYAKIASKAVADHGGEFLVRGGAATQLEGHGRERNVVIRWPDTDAALAFYNGTGYQEALKHGLPASTREYVIVEGVPGVGEQPARMVDMH